MHGFINRVSSATSLKEGLDVQQLRVRGIASRVSQASLNNLDGFALPTTSIAANESEDALALAAGANTADVDLEAEMTNLADAQLRFEAVTKLLSKSYAQIRTSIRER